MAAPTHHLALLPLQPPLDAGEALDVMSQLERTGSLVVVDAVVVEHEADGTFGISTPRDASGTRVSVAAWTWLLGDALGLVPRGVAQQPSSLDGAVPELSESFLTELRAALPTARGWLALILAGLDVGPVVAALRRYPGAKLIYGRLPEGRLEHLRRV